MTDTPEQIPVIWTPRGDKILAVTTSHRPLAGWTRLLNPQLGQTLTQLSGLASASSESVQVRTFTMREVDLKFWDNAVRKGADGYSYGLVWGEDAKFLKNLQFKEVPPACGPGTAPPIDPAMLAMAAALHQIQQTLARMEDKLDQIQSAVEWLEARRQSKQAAVLLTAASTLSSVGRRCLATGTVHPEDLLRIAHLEQVVGTVHREICMEMQDFASVLAFTTVKDAKTACKLDADRVADIVALDAYALGALKTWHELVLLSKAANGRLTLGEVEEARSELLALASAMTDAVSRLQTIDTEMNNRSILRYMTSTGIPKGRRDDAALRERAKMTRTQAKSGAMDAAKQITAIVNSLEALPIDVGDSPPLRLVAHTHVA